MQAACALPPPCTANPSLQRYQLQEGVEILVVEGSSESSLREALAVLRDSMQASNFLLAHLI